MIHRFDEKGNLIEVIESPKSEHPEQDYEDYEGPFVASEIRPHFHRPECKWVLEISTENLVRYSSHAEAVAAGKKPCKTCRA